MNKFIVKKVINSSLAVILSILVVINSACAQTNNIESISLENNKDITIQVLMEDLYPLHYLKNGKIVGSSVDLIKKIFTKAKINYTVELQPWARVYNTALQKPNVLLISIARIKQREALFTWIGPVIKFNYFLYGLANTKVDAEMKIENIQKYHVAIIRKTAIHQYLKSKNINNYQLVGSSKQAIKMLLAHRVDLVSGIENIFTENCYRLKLACEKIKPLYRFKDIFTDIHIAMSKATDAAIVNRIKLAYKEIIEEDKANTPTH
ncbi:MAG: hypothetical protein COB35_03510 [Gammaproteobacteria bacterium]|nr:MAG: hypothetical protein COB35_03510 [Gammaproteobacteria bacterium]